MIRSDNGCAFIDDSLRQRFEVQGIDHAFIEKGTRQRHPFVERFNGTMYDEVPNDEFFHNILEARAVLAERVEHHNKHRPHRGLGMMPPEAFFKSIK